jgi:hypothetical protein
LGLTVRTNPVLLFTKGEKTMNKYKVGVKIYNSFEVEAESEEDAEMKVREMDLYDTFEHCDYNICYVDEIKEMSDAKALYESTGGRIYCDDEHGNTL